MTTGGTRCAAESLRPGRRRARYRGRTGGIRSPRRRGSALRQRHRPLVRDDLLISCCDSNARPYCATPSLNATGGTWLICIDRFPGVERFIGLGQLTAEQLATLVEHKLPVTDQQFDYAARASGFSRRSSFRAHQPDRSGTAAVSRCGASKAARRISFDLQRTFALGDAGAASARRRSA